MYNYLATLRTPQSDAPKSIPWKPRRRKSVPSPPAPLENFSAQRASLSVCLSTREAGPDASREELMLIRQASPSAETAYGLAQAFMQMIREHTGQQLDTWISSVEASRRMKMSFDINEAVFDSEGTYLEEKAVRYEHALMEQFAASRRVTRDHPDGNRTGLG